MSVVLAAVYRLEMQYTVLGVNHVTRMFVDSIGTQTGGDYNITSKTGSPTVFVSDVVDAFWVGWEDMWHAAALTIGSAIFSHRVGSVWNPLQAYITAVVPSGSGSDVVGWETTVILRDTSFHKIPLRFAETFANGFHRQTAPVVGNVLNTAGSKWLLGTSATPDADGFNVLASRGDLEYASFVSAIVGPNDQYRSHRGVR
jgi:hypothetical protein